MICFNRDSIRDIIDMMPPVSIESLSEEWKKDSPIDITRLSDETSRIPVLHSKYSTILSYHNMCAKKLERQFYQLKAIKWQYYNGDLNNQEDLEKYGFEPLLKKVMKQNIQIFLDADEELNDILMKIAKHKEIVDLCTLIIKEINNRTYQVGNIIKQEIYLGGGP